MIEDLILYQKVFDFLIWIYPQVNKFPKNQRFVLGQRIEQRVLDVLESVVLIAKEKFKLPHAKRASQNLEMLKILLRAAVSLKFINIKSYGVSSEKILEIEKLLGGIK